MKKNKKIKLVTIGGGAGQYVLLSGLRDLKGVNITSIVSMVDSGGSTGRLRDEYGVLPPGDALKCLLALTPSREAARKILLTRLKNENRLKGHNAGNMLITMFAQYAGNFPDGIKAMSEILNIKGTVLPVTTDRATLVAELADGERIYGETEIDIPKNDKTRKITKTYLVPHHTDSIKVYPPVLEAIKEADYIIIGPGDLYSSLTPNFLVPGVTEEIKKSSAKLIYIVNIMTKFGESDDFKVNDFTKIIEDKLNRKLDYIFVNNGEPTKDKLKRYKGQRAELVKINQQLKNSTRKYIIDNFLNDNGEVARHDSEKLAEQIDKLIKKI